MDYGGDQDYPEREDGAYAADMAEDADIEDPEAPLNMVSCTCKPPHLLSTYDTALSQ
jgi:hypothetical protein